MKESKILMYIAVILIVILIILLFISFFSFEKDEEDTSELPDVTEEEITKLYSYIPDNPMGLQTMYVGYYVTIINISNDIIQTMVYDYILNYDTIKLEKTSLDEMYENGILNSTNNTSDINPLYKISVSAFNDIFPQIFGQNASFRVDDFRYNYDTVARINNNNDYYFIFNNTPLNSTTNDIVFRDITKYAVTNDKKTIEIYDYYLKCDLNNNNCYNDERKNTLNSDIKYSSDFNIDNYISQLTIYKHIFRYEDGYYYWYSSELA